MLYHNMPPMGQALWRETMSTPQYVIHFLQGMADLWPHSPPDYLSPNGGGFAKDREAMRRDFAHLGQNLRSTLKKHEQASTNPR